LRKYLIVAAAAFTAIAFAAVSYAQAGDTATLDAKLTPKNAGTKQKPTNSTFTLDIVNDNTQRTMSELDVFMPTTVKLSLKGMPTCDPTTMFALDCPKSSQLGTGEAHALVGVNAANPEPRVFDVIAYKTTSLKPGQTNKPMLGFFLDERGGNDLKFLTETTLRKASGKYGQKLNIEVPKLAQQVGETYNGLVSLNAKLVKKKGRNKLISSTGCKRKKHPYKVALTFIDNPLTTKAVITDTDTAPCTK
jgi:hypothetical protein